MSEQGETFIYVVDEAGRLFWHYRRGLSIANPGHYSRLDSLHAERPPGIYLAGYYFAHAGVEAAIFSGELAANRLSQAPPPGNLPRVPRPADGRAVTGTKGLLLPGQRVHHDFLASACVGTPTGPRTSSHRSRSSR